TELILLADSNETRECQGRTIIQTTSDQQTGRAIDQFVKLFEGASISSCMAVGQARRNSSRCSAAHSRTNPSARRGILPAEFRHGSISHLFVPRCPQLFQVP